MLSTIPVLNKGEIMMENRKTHIEFDDFGAYEEYLDDMPASKGPDSFSPYDAGKYTGGWDE